MLAEHVTSEPNLQVKMNRQVFVVDWHLVTHLAEVEAAMFFLLFLFTLLTHSFDDLVRVPHGERSRVAAPTPHGGRIERELRPETRAALRVRLVVRHCSTDQVVTVFYVPPRHCKNHNNSACTTRFFLCML